MPVCGAQLDIYRTAIPMRKFEHAAATRELAESVVIRLTLDDGTAGWGETLPREYVTGETMESVIAEITRTWESGSFDFSDDKPSPDTAAPAPAARCAMTLAWDDAQARSSGVALCGAIPAGVRVTGVLGSSDPARTAKRLRLMRLYGLRDFKLKLGFGPDIDAENLRLVHRRIGRAIAKGKCSLRVDVNGGWKADETPGRVAELRQYGVCAVEQPVFCGAAELADLARGCELPLIADESLIAPRDLAPLLAAGGKVWLNIRLSKNGGLAACAGMATRAAQAGVPYVIGAMVGESSILSAAQRCLLSRIPAPRFVEGNYGRFLLGADLTTKSIRFGYGGKLKSLPGPGLGGNVSDQLVKRHGTLVRHMG